MDIRGSRAEMHCVQKLLSQSVLRCLHCLKSELAGAF